MRDQTIDIVHERKQEISELQSKIINDYDAFIQSLQTTLVSDDSQTATLGAALFTANEDIVDTVKAEPNPTASYLELNKKVMDGFANALDKYGPEELNMSLLTYNETKNYVKNTREGVYAGLDILAINESMGESNEAKDMNPTEHKPLLAATA